MRRMFSIHPSTTCTRVGKWVLAAAAVGTLSIAGAAQSSEAPSPLVGEWILVSSDRPGTPSGIGIRRKTFTQTTWSIVQRDPARGIVVFEHGGEYALSGVDYTEKVTYAGPTTLNLVGQTFTYRVTVGDDDTYSQVDGMWNETWKRAPPPE